MLNNYSRLKIQIGTLVEHSSFLRTCKRLKVLPNFIKVKSAVDNYRTKMVIKKAEKLWLDLEIKHCYKMLAEKELKMYNLHLKITKGLSDSEHRDWWDFNRCVQEKYEREIEKVKERHTKKLSQLTVKSPCENLMPEFIPNFVVNESDEYFTENELNLLNKGFKFTPKPIKLPILESVVDIETFLKFKVPSIQCDIRETAKEAIESAKKSTHISTQAIEMMNTVKSLKSKSNVVFVKADKSNQVVILNKSDYDNRVIQLIDECKYKEITRNPLKKMVRETDQIRQKIRKVFSDRVSRNLIVSNPVLPKLYALPKTHKPGKKMRPIVSNINAPSYKLAKWLVRQMKTVIKINSCSVKNSFDLINKIEGLTFGNDEIMISFDVASLFPSIPVDIALDQLKQHLENTTRRKRHLFRSSKIMYETKLFSIP